MSDALISFPVHYTVHDEAVTLEAWARESGLTHNELIEDLMACARRGQTTTLGGLPMSDVIALLNRRQARRDTVRRWVIGSGIAVAVVSLMIAAQVVAHSVAAGL